MSLDSPQVEVGFIQLTPEQARRYEEIKRIVGDIAHEPDGLALLLNAVLLTGDSALIMMHALSDLLIGEGWSPRDVAGIVNERPIGLPRLVLPDMG